MPAPFEQLARPIGRSHFLPDAGLVLLEGLPFFQLHQLLKSGVLDALPIAIHEIVHSICEGTALENAIYLSQFRYGRDPSQIEKPRAGIRRRYAFVNHLVTPLFEGLCLFAQHDYRIDLDDLGSDCFLDALFYLFAGLRRSRARTSKPAGLLAFLAKLVVSETAGQSAVESKYDLLLSNLANPSVHIRGYLWIKDLFSRVAALVIEKPDLRMSAVLKASFFQFLFDYILNDFALSASVLDTEISDDEFENRFAAGLRQKLLWLRSDEFIPALRKLIEHPKLRDDALQRDESDRAHFLAALRRFSENQIPHVSLPSGIDKDVTSIYDIIHLGAARRHVHRSLNTSAFVAESERHPGQLDFFTVNPIYPGVQASGPLLFTLAKVSPDVKVDLHEHATISIAVILRPDKPSLDAWLLAADLSQILSRIPLTPEQGTVVAPQIERYLSKSAKIDEFLQYLQGPMSAEIPESAHTHFNTIYSELWSSHFSDGVLKRFFRDGAPQGPYYTLADAFASAHELRRYAELSLVSALIDRRPLLKRELKQRLRANAGQATNILESLLHFKDRLDFAGDATAFWFAAPI